MLLLLPEAVGAFRFVEYVRRELFTLPVARHGPHGHRAFALFTPHYADTALRGHGPLLRLGRRRSRALSDDPAGLGVAAIRTRRRGRSRRRNRAQPIFLFINDIITHGKSRDDDGDDGRARAL